jgi:hypothetical protein
MIRSIKIWLGCQFFTCNTVSWYAAVLTSELLNTFGICNAFLDIRPWAVRVEPGNKNINRSLERYRFDLQSNNASTRSFTNNRPTFSYGLNFLMSIMMAIYGCCLAHLVVNQRHASSFMHNFWTGLFKPDMNCTSAVNGGPAAGSAASAGQTLFTDCWKRQCESVRKTLQ